MSALPQAIAPNPHTNLLNVYVQIANKMGFQKIYIYYSNYGQLLYELSLFSGRTGLT
jgi:hypothetical protein